jgi:hypothetical protein
MLVPISTLAKRLVQILVAPLIGAQRFNKGLMLGEYLAASESAALRDAIEMARLRFDSVYLIRPPHNPVGAFDVRGAYDEASDRPHGLEELMDGAYEDAYQQFIEPVVGASGEQIGRAGVRRVTRAFPG